MNNHEIISTLNHLILINHDRIDGYEKALDECKQKHPELRTLFNEMLELSFENKKELEDALEDAGGIIDTGTTTRGKIHRVWMDIEAALSGFDRHTILANCETGEDACLKAYQKGLANQLPYQVKDMLIKQQEKLRSAHDRIKYLRDDRHMHQPKKE
jgi:uncharacterized protein (TIGR02284 family)